MAKDVPQLTAMQCNVHDGEDTFGDEKSALRPIDRSGLAAFIAPPRQEMSDIKLLSRCWSCMPLHPR